VVDTYNIGDELEGTVTKVVTFGAFVEILDGVEGLVHISELAQHHVENPREIIQPGDTVRVKILEIDSERRRLSLSIKRVEGQVLPLRPLEPQAPAGGDLDNVPELGLSEDVFAAADEPAGGVGDPLGGEAGVSSHDAAAQDVPSGDSGSEDQSSGDTFARADELAGIDQPPALDGPAAGEVSEATGESPAAGEGSVGADSDAGAPGTT
jgi:small subunit ribosomal protein S1